MKNKKQFFSVLISVLICVFVFGVIVYATTTIGNNVTIGGNISFSGYISAPGALTAVVGAAGTTKYCEAGYPCTYYVIFVNAQGETQGGTESNEITTDNVQINLSNIPIGPTGTTARKIYRSIWGGAYLVATINDNITTTHVDDIDYDSLGNSDMPIGNTTAGTILGGTTAALKIDESGNIAIGTANPGGTLDSPSFLSLGKTFTENAPSTGNTKSYYSQNSAITVQPGGNSTYGYYYGNNTSVTVPSLNAQTIGGIGGSNVSTFAYGSGNIGFMAGFTSGTYNYLDSGASVGDIKTMWAFGSNQGTVTSFYYGLQANVDNRSDFDGVGNIATAKAGRFRLQNATYDNWGVPTGPSNMTTAQVVYANIDNYTSGVVGSTIGTAAGFWYDLANNTGSTITNSYGLYLAAPVNTGTITNHYGIYLKNQTVSGTTNNYAIYSAGGQNYLAGNLGIGDTSPAYKLSVDGTASVSDTMYVKDVYFSGIVSASDDNGILIGEGITIKAGLASPSGACGTAGNLYTEKTTGILSICGVDGIWNPQ